jgi:glycerol-3-phosphate dehydrogenase
MAIGSSTALRDANLTRLENEVWDVLVVGAGINGAVTASALAAGGAKVALVDRGDFASATSQESSNLVWGGIKYLENYEFGLVWKLCASRNRLIRTYPQNVREIRFFVPLEHSSRGFKRLVPVLYAGTWLYWLMGRCGTRPPRLLTKKRIAAEEPCVDASMVKGGVEYSDAYLLDNDAHFVFSFVRTALNHGAAVANYVEVERCVGDEESRWRAEVTDRVADRSFEVRSRVIVNAAGPYVDALNSKNGVETGVRHVFSKGIHLVVERLTTKDHVLTFFDDTNRMFFVIPMGNRSVVGTTDTRVDRPETEVTDEDRQLVFHNINRRLAREVPLGPEDIIGERCGVRPLVVQGQGAADDEEWINLSRKHVVDVDEKQKCISIFGGKLTDCLNVGEEVFEEVRKLGVRLRDPGGVWYGEPSPRLRRQFLEEAKALHLDELPAQPDYERLSDRLWRRYGSDAFTMLTEIGRNPKLAEPVSEGTEYRVCELEYAARHEMVVTLEDFLRRRSKIELMIRRELLEAAEGVHRGCRILFGEHAEARHAEYFARETDGRSAGGA